ncbi:hypothetical protein [Huintestinicola sp.]|uniref:hypothetical protein n=1 Tax=Huintestinicola sp. TaxID=2981661 RepID=UPI003D7DE764
MSRKKKIGLCIIIVLCAVFFFPLYVKKQFVQGIAVSSNDKLAVAVDSVISGESVYLYIYSDDKLQGIRTLTFRGGIGEMTTENDLICIYHENLKFIYDFDGVLLRKETTEIDHPLWLHEFKSGARKKTAVRNTYISKTKQALKMLKSIPLTEK